MIRIFFPQIIRMCIAMFRDFILPRRVLFGGTRTERGMEGGYTSAASALRKQTTLALCVDSSSSHLVRYDS